MPRKPSASCIELVKRLEGCRLKSYQDEKGVWTVGYGHTGPDVFRGLKIDEPMAERLLAQDLEWATKAVDEKTPTWLNQHQFDALVSFTFNVGAPQFAGSTLLLMLRSAGADVGARELAAASAADEFPKWNKVTIVERIDGKDVKRKVPSAILTNRRTSERRLFELPCPRLV